MVRISFHMPLIVLCLRLDPPYRLTSLPSNFCLQACQHRKTANKTSGDTSKLLQGGIVFCFAFGCSLDGATVCSTSRSRGACEKLLAQLRARPQSHLQGRLSHLGRLLNATVSLSHVLLPQLQFCTDKP